ncbi:MAG: hypothetical protein ACP5MZ_00180 [Candidatus Micrarchaeia archaeon]
MASKDQKIGPRCIICGEAKEGLPVKEDYIIASIRWVNRHIFHKYRNYRLVVCKDCYLKYSKQRDKYVRKQITYVIIGVLFTLALFFSSRGNPISLLYGLAVIVFMYALSLTSYVPALNIQKHEQEKAKTKRHSR